MIDVASIDPYPPADMSPEFADLLEKLHSQSATVAIIGLGYVGLPLCRAFVAAGFSVLGLDIDPNKVDALNNGQSYLAHIPAADIEKMVATGQFRASVDFDLLAGADCVLICVPTPLTQQREPNLSYVEDTTRQIAARLRPGQLVVLESTTYPGTTSGVVKPLLLESGFICGRDFFLGYSPEREDPGNVNFETSTIPKVIGGECRAALLLMTALYEKAVQTIVPVATTEAAEAVKLTENIFRSINIALVNELKIIYAAMDIDIWEVIEAAKTKPFGYMPFYPGPGLGGHCIPIDPFYLTWKAREFNISTRFIELAGEINTSMPNYVVDRLALALDEKLGKGLSRSKILISGIAYKKNVDDMRESPALRIMDLLERRGAVVSYHDPLVPMIPTTRNHQSLSGRISIPLDPIPQGLDAVVICVDHDDVDYEALSLLAPVLVDTRNIMVRKGLYPEGLIKA